MSKRIFEITCQINIPRVTVCVELTISRHLRNTDLVVFCCYGAHFYVAAVAVVGIGFVLLVALIVCFGGLKGVMVRIGKEICHLEPRIVVFVLYGLTTMCHTYLENPSFIKKVMIADECRHCT